MSSFIIDISKKIIDKSKKNTDNKIMLDKIFGNETIATIYLNLFHYNEIYSALIEKNSQIGSRAILNQLNKMEEAGILVSRSIGRTRLYQFNPKSPFVKPIKEIIEITYSNMNIKLKEKMFKERMRPRAKGKEVLS